MFRVPSYSLILIIIRSMFDPVHLNTQTHTYPPHVYIVCALSCIYGNTMFAHFEQITLSHHICLSPIFISVNHFIKNNEQIFNLTWSNLTNFLFSNNGKYHLWLPIPLNNKCNFASSFSQKRLTYFLTLDIESNRYSHT